MLPTFIVIGAARSGTTWLHYTLSQHPEIFVSPRKEVDFFSSHWKRGVGWYEEFFRDANGASAIGEVSPAYSYESTATPERIASVVPGAKLIYVVRNPVERSWSHYTWERFGLGHQIGDFWQAIELPNAVPAMVLGASRYAEHISNYLGRFSKEQLLVLVHEDLSRNPRAFLQGVLEHVGVDPTFAPPGFAKKINARYQVQRDALQRLLFHFAKTRVRTAIEAAIPARYREPVRTAVKNFLGKEATQPVPPDVKRFLQEHFQKDIIALEEYLGRRLDDWQD